MPLITLDKVMKQIDNQIILKNIDLTIDHHSSIGVKMTNQESKTFFQLLSGTLTPSGGSIQWGTTSWCTDYNDDGLYDDLTVHSYLHFFKKLANYRQPLEDHMEKFSLMDIWKSKIKNLTIDQKQRVILFRMFLMEPELLFIESPLMKLTNEGIELYLKSLEYLRTKNIATVITSFYMEELLLLSTEVYRYHPFTGLEKTDLMIDSTVDEQKETERLQPNRVFKISSKLSDTTVFFSPDEIDFIESINGVSNIRIGEESFPSVLTMSELENKLTKFGFFRCHRSYLVNLQRIAELVSYSRNSYTLILKGSNGTKISLSRSKLDELKELLEF